jgi:hypothetical protein
MIDEIICIGTSLTEGGGLNSERDFQIVDWYEKVKGVKVKDTTHSYPAVIETKLEIKTRNIGKCGSGINYLMRNVENILESENVTNKLFILEYSNSGREELYLNKANTFVVGNFGPEDGVNPKNGFASFITLNYNWCYSTDPTKHLELHDEMKIWDKYLDAFHNDHDWMIKNDRNFLNLIYKLQSKNIKFIIHGQNPYWEEMYNEPILMDNYVKFWYNQTAHPKDGFCTWNWITTNKLGIEHETNKLHDDGHPTPTGHIQIADKLIDFLKNKKHIV